MKLLIILLILFLAPPLSAPAFRVPKYQVYCLGKIEDRSLKVYFSQNGKQLTNIKTFFGVCLYKMGEDTSFVRLKDDGMKFNCDPMCGDSNAINLYFYENVFSQLPSGLYHVYLRDIRGYKNNIESESNFIYLVKYYLGEITIE